MPLIEKFGDIFRYREEEYVYLAQNGEIIYAAKILDKEKTDKVLKLYKNRCRTNKIEKVKSNVLYSFVILSTDEFKDRMAHFPAPLESPPRDSSEITMRTRFLVRVLCRETLTWLE